MRYMFVAIVGLAALTTRAYSDEVKSPPDYYPAKVGQYRTYVGVGGGAKPLPVVVKVTKAEKTEAGLRVEERVSSDLKEWGEPDHRLVTTKGVFMTHTRAGELKEPIPILRYPVKEADTWSSEVTDDKEGKATFTFTVGKKEKVKVEAGEYDAVPVTMEVKIKERTNNSIYWYAPGTGVVQFAIGSEDAQVVMGLAALETEK